MVRNVISDVGEVLLRGQKTGIYGRYMELVHGLWIQPWEGRKWGRAEVVYPIFGDIKPRNMGIQ